MKKIILLCALVSANVNAGEIIRFDNLEFPALKSHRMQADNPYYMYRTIIITAGKVALDEPTTSEELDASVLPSDFVETKSFCELHMAYYAPNGFPTGEIDLATEKYPVAAKIEPGMSSAGSFEPGKNTFLHFYISRPLSAVSEQPNWARASIKVGAVDASVWITGIECSLKGMSADLKNADLSDEGIIRASLGDSVSFTTTN